MNTINALNCKQDFCRLFQESKQVLIHSSETDNAYFIKNNEQ